MQILVDVSDLETLVLWSSLHVLDYKGDHVPTTVIDAIRRAEGNIAEFTKKLILSAVKYTGTKDGELTAAGEALLKAITKGEIK